MRLETWEENKLNFSDHATKRMKQRCLKQKHAALIFWFGTEISEYEIFFSAKNAQEAETFFKGQNKNDNNNNSKKSVIKKLVGWKIVVDGSKVITCYRCTKKHQKKRIARKLAERK